MSQFNEYNMPGPGDPETWPPCTGHPNDPRTPDDTEEIQGRKQELFEERIRDINDYLPESFSEAPSESLIELSRAILDDDEAQIGFIVMRMVRSYCWPSLDDVKSIEPEPPEPDEDDDYHPNDDYEYMGGHF